MSFSLLKERYQPFQTDFGYHIIYVKKIKGQEIELRHILLSPTVTEESLTEAKEKITLIKKELKIRKSLLRKQQEPYRMKRNKSKWWSINQSTNPRHAF
jgi:parvulin-like peptidyl-prolyl isomerase